MSAAAVAGVLGFAKSERAASPFEMIARIEHGLPVGALDRVAAIVAPEDANFKYRIVPRPTLARRRQQRGKRLTAEESALLARLAQAWTLRARGLGER